MVSREGPIPSLFGDTAIIDEANASTSLSWYVISNVCNY